MGFSLIEGFFKSIAMIVVSEIGDKTFFVAALLAMRHSRVTVFSGALGALAVMTVFSAFFGWAAPNLISRTWTHNGATVLFFLFGLKSLWDGITHEGGESAELAEVEAQLKAEGKRDDDATSRSQKSQKRGGKQQQSFLSKVLSPVFLEVWIPENRIL
jgi:putative Ca2+/H+ antiporter (TMEM165/GDT1 family)